MDILKKIMTNKQSDWYIQILEWCIDHALVWTTLVLGWRGLDLGFKEIRRRDEIAARKAEADREAFIRQIVQDEISKSVAHELGKLSSEVRLLGDAIFKLNTKL